MLKQVFALFLVTSMVALASPGHHLRVGDQLPQIKEVDQNGTMRRLNKIKGKKGTLFVIFRSADW